MSTITEGSAVQMPLASEFDLSSIGRDQQASDTEVLLIEMRDEQKFQSEVQSRPMAGISSSLPPPVCPMVDEFLYRDDDLLIQSSKPPKPGADTLHPPPSSIPPPGCSFPQSLTWQLKWDSRYLNGWIYAADYHIKERLRIDKDRMATISTPPNVAPSLENGRYVSSPIPGMVKMIAGVPFVFFLDGDIHRPYTVGCAHTLDSLRRFPDWDTILNLSVRLAKLTWGCKAHNNTPAIPRLCTLDGLKRNDRSAKNVKSLPLGSRDGSYSLANTVAKGEGPGVVLPACQANTVTARQQIATVLQVLHRLYRHIMPKSISKFEMAMADFHSEYNNVVTFGGLEPGPTSCQFNSSSFGKALEELLGYQGFWHPDNLDDITRYTLFVLLLHIGPTGDPGPFCLGRGGIYCREVGAWIVFLVFKGNDMHSGFAPTEDAEQHRHWVESQLSAAWDHAGPENRQGYVLYQTTAATNRNAGMNMSPQQIFGNFGTMQPYRSQQSTFTSDGFASLGGEYAWANRMGREVVLSLYNQLRWANLTLDIDLNTILKSISYTSVDDRQVSLKPLPYHPIHDQSLITKYLSYYSHLRSECTAMYIHVDRHGFKQWQIQNRVQIDTAAMRQAFNPTERRCVVPLHAEASTRGDDATTFDIERVLGRKIVNGRAYLTVQEQGKELQSDIAQEHLLGNPKAIEFLRQFLPGVQPPISTDTTEQTNVVLPGSRSLFELEPETRHYPEEEQVQRSKRKRSSTTNTGNYGTRDTEGSDGESEVDDQEYEVEEILSTRINHAVGQREWEVKWVGYAGTSWLRFEDLNCLELLNEFKLRNPSLFTEEPDDSEAQQPITMALMQSGFWDPTKLGGNLKILTNFLHSPRIRAELHTLQNSGALGTIKAYKKPASTASILADWFHRNNEYNIMDSYLSVLPEKSLSAGPILLHQTVHAAQGMMDVVADIAKLHIITRLGHWESARSLISVYLWHARYAPKLAEQLVSVYTFQGYDHLKAISPSFAGLVDHIFRFVVNEQENPKQSKAGLKRRKINQQPSGSTIPQISDSSKLVDLENLPSQLLGHGNGSSRISLRKSCYSKSYSGSWRGNAVDRHALVRKRTSALLQELWSFELIVPHLIGIDSRLNGSRRSASQPAQVRDRALARGAVLHCVAQVCGTDTMFASLQAIDLISSPTLIYGERLKKDRDFARTVLKDETSALQPLVNWLTSHIQEDPDLIPLFKELGKFVHCEAVDLQFGSPSSQQSKRVQASTGSSRTRKKLFSPIARQQLLPDDQSPRFSLIGLILREAINERRGLKPGNEILFRVLTGVHASRNSTITHNRDQTDPVRQYNRTAILLQKYLPGAKLTTREGLSNLLAWMGTGQGNKTSPFLDFITTRGEFFSDSLETMVWKFEQVMGHNAALLATQSTGRRVGERVPGFIPLDDMQIWGQSCNQLSATPMIQGAAQEKMTLEDKFSPYFATTVQDSWIEFLGDLAVQNPMQYSGRRKTWNDGLNFVRKLQVKGFLQGLTQLQLVNNLVFLGILAMPEPVDIADWIYDNPNLGAYPGLANLGFALSDCGSVRCAFMCVYEHLNRYMTHESKELVGFNPIFVEHILCKIERWNGRLKKEVSPETRLDTIAEPIPHSGAYVWNSSETGHKDAFPFPLEATLQELDKIIDETASTWMA